MRVRKQQSSIRRVCAVFGFGIPELQLPRFTTSIYVRHIPTARSATATAQQLGR
jgi:hypothetical protein